jgi:hypothetical protein
MNLLETELVRNLVSLIQRAEADDLSGCSSSRAATPTMNMVMRMIPRQLRPDEMHALARALLNGATGSE